jgi:hypothetical protein
MHPLTLNFAPGIELTSSALNHHRRLMNTYPLSMLSTYEPSDDSTHLRGGNFSFYLPLFDYHGQPWSPGFHVLPAMTKRGDVDYTMMC